MANAAEQAFQRGFLKRAEEYNIPFVHAQQLLKQAEFSHSLEQIKNTLYPATHDSLFDVANSDQSEGNRDIKEILAAGKHLGSHGLAPGAVGAGLGAVGGLITSNKEDNKLGKASKGALIGGTLGFGSGVLNDAYHLGDNTRKDLVSTLEEQRDRIPRDHQWPWSSDQESKNRTERLNHNIDTLKETPWYKYFVPGLVDKKLV